jgi:hypothetical protein
VLGTIGVPHDTVVFASGVRVGSVAGLTVIVRDTEASALPQTSVAVQVSVIVPPHGPGVAENVERFEIPLNRQPSVSPLVKVTVLATIAVPHGTVTLANGVNTGSAAGWTVMFLETEASALPQTSVAVQVSVMVPPHGPGVAEKVERFEIPLNRQPSVRPLV